MKSVTVINFKGGVGKTTLSLHLACFLAQTSRVLLIDVDHQSSLSIVILGNKFWEDRIKQKQTVNRVFESFCNRKVAMPGTSIITANVLHERNHRYNLYPSLDFVSAEFELDDTEIDLASTNYGNPLLSEWEKRTLLAVSLDNIGAKDKYDYVIFDCPPATKIVSQNALVASQKYIIPVIPEDISSRGVTHFRHLIKTKIDDKLSFLKSNARVSDADTPGNYVPTTVLAGIAPFLVRHAGRAVSGYTNIHTEQLAALRKQWRADVLAKEAQYFTGIAEAVNAGWPVWNYWGQNAKPRVKSMMRSICDELKGRIDQ